MKFFDFVKDAGRQLFDRDEVAAERIEALVTKFHPSVKNFDASFDDGKVALKGDCDCEETQQKVAMLVGNVAGVESVNVDKLDFPEPVKEAAAPAIKIYEIKSGDSLSKIAKEFYGDAMAYQRIFEANREVIEDPNKIYPGQRIRIPQ